MANPSLAQTPVTVWYTGASTFTTVNYGTATTANNTLIVAMSGNITSITEVKTNNSSGTPLTLDVGDAGSGYGIWRLSNASSVTGIYISWNVGTDELISLYEVANLPVNSLDGTGSIGGANTLSVSTSPASGSTDLVISAINNNTYSITTPTGWTNDGGIQSGPGFYTGIAHKFATSSGVQTAAWGGTPAPAVWGVVAAYQGITGTVPVAPNTPTGTVSTNQVTLSWTDNSNGGTAITSHKVETYNSAGTVLLFGPTITGSPSTTYNVSGLTNGTGYTFKVSATNSVGDSAYSTLSSVYTPTAGSGSTPTVLQASTPAYFGTGSSYRYVNFPSPTGTSSDRMLLGIIFVSNGFAFSDNTSNVWFYTGTNGTGTSQTGDLAFHISAPFGSTGDNRPGIFVYNLAQSKNSSGPYNSFGILQSSAWPSNVDYCVVVLELEHMTWAGQLSGSVYYDVGTYTFPSSTTSTHASPISSSTITTTNAIDLLIGIGVIDANISGGLTFSDASATTTGKFNNFVSIGTTGLTGAIAYKSVTSTTSWSPTWSWTGGGSYLYATYLLAWEGGPYTRTPSLTISYGTDKIKRLISRAGTVLTENILFSESPFIKYIQENISPDSIASFFSEAINILVISSNHYTQTASENIYLGFDTILRNIGLNITPDNFPTLLDTVYKGFFRLVNNPSEIPAITESFLRYIKYGLSDTFARSDSPLFTLIRFIPTELVAYGPDGLVYIVNRIISFSNTLPTFSDSILNFVNRISAASTTILFGIDSVIESTSLKIVPDSIQFVGDQINTLSSFLIVPENLPAYSDLAYQLKEYFVYAIDNVYFGVESFTRSITQGIPIDSIALILDRANQMTERTLPVEALPVYGEVLSWLKVIIRSSSDTFNFGVDKIGIKFIPLLLSDTVTFTDAIVRNFIPVLVENLPTYHDLTAEAHVLNIVDNIALGIDTARMQTGRFMIDLLVFSDATPIRGFIPNLVDQLPTEVDSVQELHYAYAAIIETANFGADRVVMLVARSMSDTLTFADFALRLFYRSAQDTLPTLNDLTPTGYRFASRFITDTLPLFFEFQNNVANAVENFPVFGDTISKFIGRHNIRGVVDFVPLVVDSVGNLTTSVIINIIQRSH